MNKTEDELYSAQEYLQSFFTYNRDAIAVFSLDGKVIKVNDAFEQIYGWKAEEIVRKIIPFIPTDLTGGAESRLERAKKGEKLVAFETQDKRKDGKIIDVEITISPVFNRDQQIVALFGISRDLTEEKETAKFLRQTDKLSLAGEMAAGIAKSTYFSEWIYSAYS
jgi:PAS domain S-box-containing protein